MNLHLNFAGEHIYNDDAGRVLSWLSTCFSFATDCITSLCCSQKRFFPLIMQPDQPLCNLYLSEQQEGLPVLFQNNPQWFLSEQSPGKLVKHFGWMWVGAVRRDNDSGNSGLAAFTKAAHHGGVCVGYSEAISRTDPGEHIARVVRVIQSGSARVLVANRTWPGCSGWTANPRSQRVTSPRESIQKSSLVLLGSQSERHGSEAYKTFSCGCTPDKSLRTTCWGNSGKRHLVAASKATCAVNPGALAPTGCRMSTILSQTCRSWGFPTTCGSGHAEHVEMWSKQRSDVWVMHFRQWV